MILENKIPENTKLEWQSRKSAGNRKVCQGNVLNLMYINEECRAVIIVKVAVCVERNNIPPKDAKPAKYGWLVHYLQSTPMDVHSLQRISDTWEMLTSKMGSNFLTLDIGKYKPETYTDEPVKGHRGIPPHLNQSRQEAKHPQLPPD